MEAIEKGWDGGVYRAWATFHGWFTTLALIVALVLTVVSFVVYLQAFRRIERGDRL